MTAMVLEESVASRKYWARYWADASTTANRKKKRVDCAAVRGGPERAADLRVRDLRSGHQTDASRWISLRDL